MLNKRHFTVDEALEQTGGFGIFQFFLTFAIMFIRQSGNYFYCGFAFLTLKQQYLCLGADGYYTQCSVETVCQGREAGLQYKVDTGYEDYIENWQ